MTKHDGVQVDAILIDQAKLGEALRQVRASNLDLPVALGLQFADRALEDQDGASPSSGTRMTPMMLQNYFIAITCSTN